MTWWLQDERLAAQFVINGDLGTITPTYMSEVDHVSMIIITAISNPVKIMGPHIFITSDSVGHQWYFYKTSNSFSATNNKDACILPLGGIDIMPGN